LSLFQQKEDLYVRGGKILNPEPFFYDEKQSPDVVIDCNGCLIAPGKSGLDNSGSQTRIQPYDRPVCFTQQIKFILSVEDH
jgi:N-acetylglucosamine-6-phosphate deacetylase